MHLFYEALLCIINSSSSRIVSISVSYFEGFQKTISPHFLDPLQIENNPLEQKQPLWKDQLIIAGPLLASLFVIEIMEEAGFFDPASFSQQKTAAEKLRFGGGRWIRTTEGIASRFTVCPLWPLGNSPIFNSHWMELVDGLEPPTCWLQISCSTHWATPASNRLDYNSKPLLKCQAFIFAVSEKL